MPHQHLDGMARLITERVPFQQVCGDGGDVGGPGDTTPAGGPQAHAGRELSEQRGDRRMSRVLRLGGLVEEHASAPDPVSTRSGVTSLVNRVMTGPAP